MTIRRLAARFLRRAADSLDPPVIAGPAWVFVPSATSVTTAAGVNWDWRING